MCVWCGCGRVGVDISGGGYKCVWVLSVWCGVGGVGVSVRG